VPQALPTRFRPGSDDLFGYPWNAPVTLAAAVRPPLSGKCPVPTELKPGPLNLPHQQVDDKFGLCLCSEGLALHPLLDGPRRSPPTYASVHHSSQDHSAAGMASRRQSRCRNRTLRRSDDPEVARAHNPCSCSETPSAIGT
jgi:hypothetical protein